MITTACNVFISEAESVKSCHDNLALWLVINYGKKYQNQ